MGGRQAAEATDFLGLKTSLSRGSHEEITLLLGQMECENGAERAAAARNRPSGRSPFGVAGIDEVKQICPRTTRLSLGEAWSPGTNAVP